MIPRKNEFFTEQSRVGLTFTDEACEHFIRKSDGHLSIFAQIDFHWLNKAVDSTRAGRTIAIGFVFNHIVIESILEDERAGESNT